MKTLVTLIAAVLTVITVAAQDYYKNGALIKINDSLTFKCSISEYFINLENTKQYDRDYTSNRVQLKNRSVFKQALEETFTPEELEKYKNVTIVIRVIHDASAKPVDVYFAFDKENGSIIPPEKVAELRGRLIKSIEFHPIFEMDTDKYYSWDEGLIAPIWYYRDAKYIDRGKKK